MLNKVLKGAERASRYAVWAGGAMLIFSAFMVSADVLLRKFFGFSFGAADEISGYLFAISTAFAFSFALLHRANVRIDALYMHLPARLQAVLDIVSLLALGSFAYYLTYRAYFVFENNLIFWSKSITPLQTPLAVPQGFWLLGLVLFCLTLLLVLVATVVALLKGDLNLVNRISGMRSIEEEVEEETHVSTTGRSGSGGGA